MTIEEQLNKIAAEYDLRAISINLYRRENGDYWVGAYVHGANDGPCGSCSNTGSTISIAISEALADLNGKRYPLSVPELEAFPTMEGRATE